MINPKPHVPFHIKRVREVFEVACHKIIYFRDNEPRWLSRKRMSVPWPQRAYKQPGDFPRSLLRGSLCSNRSAIELADNTTDNILYNTICFVYDQVHVRHALVMKPYEQKARRPKQMPQSGRYKFNKALNIRESLVVLARATYLHCPASALPSH